MPFGCHQAQICTHIQTLAATPALRMAAQLCPQSLSFLLLLILTQDISPIFRVEGKGGGRERDTEKHKCERDALIICLPHVPRPGPGTEPATQVRAIDQESNPRPFSEGADALTI